MNYIKVNYIASSFKFDMRLHILSFWVDEIYYLKPLKRKLNDIGHHSGIPSHTE